MDDLDFLDDDQDEIEDLDFPIDPYDDMLIEEPEWIDDSQDNCVLDQEFIDNHLNIIPSEVLHNFPFVEDDVDAITDYELFSKGFGYLDENKVNKDELSNVAYTGDYNDLSNKPDIPDMSEYVKKDTTDLENYPLTSSLSSVAFSGDYDDLFDKPTIPTKTSDITNDSGYITKDVNDLTYYTKTADLPIVPTKTSDLTNDSGFITKTVNDLTNYSLTSSLSSVAFSGDYDDLSDKPTIPTKTSDLTNDSGFITKTVNDLTNYTLTSSLSTVATSGNYNDLSNKPTIPTVPSNVSAFTNDAGYITNSVNNLTNYTNTTNLTSLLDNKENKVISGNNNNGSYLKFDDGTLICWKTDDYSATITNAWGVLYESTSSVDFGSLPETFISIPCVTASNAGMNGCFIESVKNTSTSAWGNSYLVRPNSRGTATYTISLIAIGKWK